MRGGASAGRGSGGGGRGRGRGDGGNSASRAGASSSTSGQSSPYVRISGGRGSEPEGLRIPAITARPPPVSTSRATASANYLTLENTVDSLFAARAAKAGALEHEGTDSNLHHSLFRSSLNFLEGL